MDQLVCPLSCSWKMGPGEGQGQAFRLVRRRAGAENRDTTPSAHALCLVNGLRVGGRDSSLETCPPLGLQKPQVQPGLCLCHDTAPCQELVQDTC